MTSIRRLRRRGTHSRPRTMAAMILVVDDRHLVWGCRGSDETARVRTVMKKLRKKLDAAGANPAYIFNRHGVGYSFGDPRTA